MASIDPRSGRREGRIIPLFQPDVHVETRRLGAAAFDLLILSIVLIWLDDVFGVTQVAGAPLRPGTPYLYLNTRVAIALPWLAVLIVVLYSVQEYLFGATWGKLVAGLRVVAEDGRRPSLAAIVVRNILRLVDYWPFFYLIGGLVALISPRRQRLGDRLAHTLVVRAESAPLAYRTRRELQRNAAYLAAALALFVAFCLGFAYYGRPPLVIESLRNTNQLFPGQPVASYRLGTPRWGAGTVTYPVLYSDGHRLCNGSITLRWSGFFGGGWAPARRYSTCSA